MSNDSFGSGFGAVVGIATVLALTVGVGMYGCPSYNVYSARMAGEAEVAQAEQNRQIMVRQAMAKRDAAVMEAEAEVNRAKGVAQANKIIGDSLKGNDAYLRYLWINNLESGGHNPTVIYIPTEAGLPLLESSRLNNLPSGQLK